VRIVLDTNVLVSALLSPGSVPGIVLSRWTTDSYEMLVSEPLLAEYLRVLERPRLQDKHRKEQKEIHALIARFRVDGVLVEPDTGIRVVRADPDDDIVVATAVAGEADYIVSGDRHLLELGILEGIRVVTPAVLLVIFEEDL
jgi:uncharacterized protein